MKISLKIKDKNKQGHHLTGSWQLSCLKNESHHGMHEQRVRQNFKHLLLLVAGNICWKFVRKRHRRVKQCTPSPSEQGWNKLTWQFDNEFINKLTFSFERFIWKSQDTVCKRQIIRLLFNNNTKDAWFLAHELYSYHSTSYLSPLT